MSLTEVQLTTIAVMYHFMCVMCVVRAQKQLVLLGMLVPLSQQCGAP